MLYLSPSFALDGGEEPEIAGFYLVGRSTAKYIVLVNHLGE